MAAATVLGGLLSLARGLSAEPAGCASCHVMRRCVEGYQTGRDLDGAHARAAVSCTGCHQGYTLATRTLAALRYLVCDPGASARRRYGDELCNRCHVSLEHQALRTDFLPRNPHRNHWPELACSDCHPAHDKQVDFCGQCHENGGQRMTGEPWRSSGSGRDRTAPHDGVVPP